MLSFSRQLSPRVLTYNNNALRHSGKKLVMRERLPSREDALMKQGYNAVISKYSVTEKDLWPSIANNKRLERLYAECNKLEYDREEFFRRSDRLSRRYLRWENRRLCTELKEKDELIRKLERKRKQYIHLLDMYNGIIAECESTASIEV